MTATLPRAHRALAVPAAILAALLAILAFAPAASAGPSARSASPEAGSASAGSKQSRAKKRKRSKRPRQVSCRVSATLSRAGISARMRKRVLARYSSCLRRRAKQRCSTRRRTLTRKARSAAKGRRLSRGSKRRIRARYLACMRRERARNRKATRKAAAVGPNARQGSPGRDAAPPAEGLRVGLVANTQVHDRNAGAEQDIAREAGARWLREEFQWSLIEPQNDQWDFSRYDRVMTAAAQRGMMVLPLLMDTPGWAGATWHTVPVDPGEYAEYVAKVVERYAQGGSFWREHPELPQYAPTHFELWNETYLEAFTNNDVDPGRYARHVRAAAQAARAANPNARFLLQADTFYVAGPGNYRNWIDDMYAAVPDLNRWFDGAAVHPYSSELSPTHYTPEGNTRWQFGRLREIRERFVAHGGGDKPLWITEMGWSTCPADGDCVSEARQAEHIDSMFRELRGQYSSYVAALFLFHMRDYGSGEPGTKDHWFGLIRRDGSRKPSWDVFRANAGA